MILPALALVLAAGAAPPAPSLQLFFDAASVDEARAAAALERLRGTWRDGFAPLVVDLARLLPRGSPRARLLRFLEEASGRRLGGDLRPWRKWMWSRPYEPHPDYAAFKAALYARIDPRMAEFFPPGGRERIRLDEVDWGGVRVGGIPRLDAPRHVAAGEASFLAEGDVVFGVVAGGEARAYPKRILAWHELARDRLGEVELAVVYCTLCGTVIPYVAEAGGRRFTFGTSGLLYRSNKLMYDEETMSLWSTFDGRPVLGALAGEPLELVALPVVTTTWGEWRAAHPLTTVLSLDTGFHRDYREGAAYRDYFATDALMFEVPREDTRLRNKDEVLGLLLRPAGAPEDAPRHALAFDGSLLARRPVLHHASAGHSLVVLTTPAGANRAYEAGNVRFVRLEGSVAYDDEGRPWRVTEEALLPSAPALSPRPRLPARRAFWFGWSAQYPETELVR